MDIISQKAITEALTYNEALVRFHIMNPIVQRLGYDQIPNTYLDLEVTLPYPYFHIGHRSKKDVPLGQADYLAGLKGARGSFIVETKAGGKVLSVGDVEQAHSYAAHAQVGANFFVLCNGIELHIYETLSGSQAGPIVTIPLSQINDRFHEVENILSPVNLAKHCRVEYDRGLKLCEGLGSNVSLRSGAYKMGDYAVRFLINGEDQTEHLRATEASVGQLDAELERLKSVFELRVDAGSLARDETGRITAYARMGGATVPNREAMEIMGIDEMWLATSAEFLSTEPDNPTLFESTKDFAVAQGTMLPQLMGGLSEMASTVTGSLFIRAAMHFNGADLVGQYHSSAEFDVDVPPPFTFKVEMDIVGSFELQPDG